MEPCVLVTGGAGFIGSALVRQLIYHSPWSVVVLDALGYAGHRANLEEVLSHLKCHFVHGDIAQRCLVAELLERYRPWAVVHLAALTHVDRSIDSPEPFVLTNVLGTQRLLEQTVHYWQALPAKQRKQFRFVHMSTDEVYGSLGPQGRFAPGDPLRPRSPYAASKAAADHLVEAFACTYGLPGIVVRSCNNYGPRQYPEKLIPLMILRAIGGQELPVYGTGENVREWIHVDDTARGLQAVLERGTAGEIYHLGSGLELANRDLVNQLCEILDRLNPRPDGRSYHEQIRLVEDRPGHDFRYALESETTYRRLQWRPRVPWPQGLEQTVRWYLQHQQWVDRVRRGYEGERLGRGLQKQESQTLVH